MMVGSAVATMVLLSIAVNNAARRPASTSRISRWVIESPGCAPPGAPCVVWVIKRSFVRYR